MEHFDLNIEHRGLTKTFHGTFSKYGWSYRFTIDVEGTDVIFEPDEERNLRVIVPLGKQEDSKLRELVSLIAHELREIFM
jgi:hypothetical protein